MLKNSMILGVLMLALSSSADAALLGASTLMLESAKGYVGVRSVPMRVETGWHGVVPAFAVWGPHHWVEVP
jgi:hypothetical protein